MNVIVYTGSCLGVHLINLVWIYDVYDVYLGNQAYFYNILEGEILVVFY